MIFSYIHKTRSLSILVFFSLAMSLLAGDGKDDRMKKAIEKDSKRALESAKRNGDMKYYEKRYGHLKESHPEQYTAMIQARKNAASVWSDVAKKIASAKDYDEIHAHRVTAYDAQDIAELALFEMKSAESISNWQEMAEKSGSKEMSEIAQKLVTKQEELVQATISRFVAEKSRRQLELERKVLDKEFRQAYDAARKAKYEERKK